MVKLQEIKRKDNTNIFSLVLPKEMVEHAQLKKGDNLVVDCPKIGFLSLVKKDGDC